MSNLKILQPVLRLSYALYGPVKWLAFFSVATNMLMLAVPIHMMQVYDRVLSSRSVETLLYLTLVVIAALAVFGTAESLRSQLSQRLSARYATAHAERLFAKLVGAHHGSSDDHRILRDFSQVRVFLSSKQMVGLFDLPFAPIFLILMFLLHITLGALTLVGILALVGIAAANNKWTAHLQETSGKSANEAQGFAQAALARAEDIRAMGLMPNIMARWGGKTAEALNTADSAAERNAKFFGLSRFVRQTLQISMMAWGAYLAIQGDISAGLIFAASMISGRALLPIEQVIGGWSNIAQAYASYLRVDEFLKSKNKAQPLVALPSPQGEIGVECLTYNADGAANAERPILDNLSFRVSPGTIVAIIGPSGAGKSTLARLLVGAIQPSKGNIRLDGFELDQWSDGVRGAAIGYVPQDIALFPGTIAENIARLDPAPDEQRIIDAALKSGVHELVARMPDGYQTLVGGAGISLSGGQRQRIALARAFYSDPKVLVLDEPNAHLDQEGEQLLMNALLTAQTQLLTIIVVTQRRSMLKAASHVLLLKDGRIAAFQDRETFMRSVSRNVHHAPPAETAAEFAFRQSSMQPNHSHINSVGFGTSKPNSGSYGYPTHSGTRHA